MGRLQMGSDWEWDETGGFPKLYRCEFATVRCRRSSRSPKGDYGKKKSRIKNQYMLSRIGRSTSLSIRILN